MENDAIRYAYIARNKKHTECILYESHLTYTIILPGRENLATHNASYSDILKIHLSKPDIGWYGMDIHLKNGQRLHFKNLAFYRVENNKMRRVKVNPEDNRYVAAVSNSYLAFVLALHKRIWENGLAENTVLSYGSTLYKLFILAAILVTGAIILPMAFQFSSVGRILFFITAALLLIFFYFKIDFKRKYRVDHIPLSYIPVAR